MDEKIQEKIVNIAHEEHGWKTNEVRVDEVDELKHGSCSFYAVRHKVKPLSYLLNYAVISGEKVIGVSDEQAVAKILDACGSDASAVWWAEIIARFHKSLGSGVVLIEPKQNFGAMDLIKSAKKEFTPPKFSDEAGGKSVSFYLLEPEEFVVYFVKASRNKDNTITVDKASL